MGAESVGTYFLYDCDRAAAERFFTVGHEFGDTGSTLRILEVLWGPELARENATITAGPWRAKVRTELVRSGPREEDRRG